MKVHIVGRFTVLIVVVSVLLLAVGVSGAWYVNRLQKQSSQILDVNVASVRAAEELVNLLRDSQYELDRSLLSPNDHHLEKAKELTTSIEKWLVESERLAHSDEDRDAVSKIRDGFQKFDRQLDRFVAQPPSQARDDNIRQLEENLLSNNVLVAATEYLDRKEQQLEDSSKRNQETSQRIELGLLLLGICGGIAGLLAGFGIARGIQKKVLQLTVPIQDAAGRLNEVVGPVSISAATGLEDLEDLLQSLSSRVAEVVQRLQDSDREVIRADQLAALGQLSAGLAHELRNPLMCMKVLVQDARQKGSSGLQPEDLEVLDEEIRRLEHLVGGFMDFARPPTIIAELFDLKEVLTQTVAFLAPRAARGLIEINCRLPEGPLVVAADRALIRQVVLNLILNSLDAVASKGRVEVQAEFVRPDSSNGDSESRPHVLVHVLDSGPGLPAGREQRIFEPFFSTKETGLGLGLATCQRIVELHGGEVVACNRPEGGAKVSVRLPRGNNDWQSRQIETRREQLTDVCD